MSINKADTYTALNNQKEFFSDFLNNFSFTPYGNSLGRVTNARSVIQSIKNLIFTIVNERLYQPDVGGNIYNTNFEFNDKVTDDSIIFNISTTINNFEPRCNLISVSAISDETDSHTLTIKIVFSLINNSDPISFTVKLRRIR